MARFYQTSEPAFVDNKINKLPWEMMAGVLQTKDKAVNDSINSAELYLDKLKAQGLKPDEPRLREIISGYQSEIQGVTDTIRSNPMEYQKQLGTIRQIGRDIGNNFENGEVAGIQGNRKLYLDYAKNLDDDYQKNPDKYSPGQIEALKAEALDLYSQNGGINYIAPGQYNTFKGENAAPMEDMTTYMKKIMEGAIQDTNVSVKWDNERGAYRVKGEKKDLWYSSDQLKNLYTDFATTNPDFLSGIKQRERLGIQGFQGNFDKDGNPVMVPGNYLQTGLDFMESKYGGKATVRENSQTMSEQGKMDYAKKLTNEEVFETAAISTDLAYDTTAGNWKSFSTAVTSTRQALTGQATDLLEKAKEAKLGEAAMRDIANGKYQVLVDAKVITSDYKKELDQNFSGLKRQEALLKNTTTDYINWAKSKNIKVESKGNNTYVVEDKNYKQFLKESGYKDKNFVNTAVSFNGIPGMTKDLQKSFQDVTEANFRNFSFNLEGSNPIYETQAGEKIQYLKEGTSYRPTPGVRVIPIKGSSVTIDQMIQNGVIGRKQYKDEVPGSGAVENDLESEASTKEYVFYKDGKPTDLKVNKKTVGLTRAYGNSGKASLGVAVEFGNNSAVATVSTEQINSLTIKNYLDRPDVQSEYQFREWRDKSNLQARKLTVKHPSTKIIYGVDRGKYYAVDPQGRKIYASSTEETEGIQKAMFNLLPLQ